MRSYTWNARDQLASLTGPVNGSFAYDAVGRRRAKTIGGTTTQFLYDGLNPVQELASGTPTANLLTGLGIDEFFTRTDGAGVRNYLTDALGSSVALTDGSGGVQTEYTYEPFGGTSVTGASTTSALAFTGRESDGTGLYYYRARYYQSTLQRFASEDPLQFASGDANHYVYVRNSPAVWSDPLGLQVPKPNGPPPIPLPDGKNGKPNSWEYDKKTGRYDPKYPVPSPKGGQPNVSWDEEDGWWRHNDGQGSKQKHVWPDGSPAPDRHPKYPPKQPPPSDPPKPPLPPAGPWLPRLPPLPLMVNPCPWMPWCAPMPGRKGPIDG